MNFAIILLLSLNVALASVGKVVDLTSNGSYVWRDKLKMQAVKNLLLEKGDTLATENGGAQVLVGKGLRIGLEKNSSVRLLGENEIFFTKGNLTMAAKSSKKEALSKIEANDVNFTFGTAKFQIFQNKDQDVILKVLSGEVTVASPHIQTFVPEVVKTNESLTFSRKEKSYSRGTFGKKAKK